MPVTRQSSDSARPVRNSLLLLQALLVSAAVVLAGMVTAYFQHLDYYTFSLLRLTPWLLMLWLLSCFVLYAMTRLLVGFLPGARHWFLPVIAVLLWLQGVFNATDYGELDGEAIEWSRYIWVYLREILFLVAVGAIFVALRRRPDILAVPVPVAVLIVQVVWAGMSIRDADLEEMPSHSLPENEIFRLSETRNVFLVILDAFQSDVLQAVLEREPDYARQLDGFVYWPNTVGFHPTTYPTVAALLLGEPYTNQPRFHDFRSRVYTEASVLHDFREADYQIDLYTRRGSWPRRLEGWGVFDNAINALHVGYTWRTVFEEAVGLLEFTLFRHGWQLARRGLYRDGRWLLSPRVYWSYPDSINHRSDLTMLEQLQARSFVEGERPLFRFIHFYTPHLPIVFDSGLRPRSARFTRESYADQAESGLRLLLGLLEILREHGVMEHSRIVVIADHGRPGIGVDNTLFDFLSGEEPHERQSDMGAVMASGLPLLLSREAGSDGPLQTRHDPVHAGDVAPSLVDGVGDASRFAGYSLFSGALPEARTRKFHHYHWRDHGWGSSYLAPLEVYKIDGHAWLPSAWSGPHYRIHEQGRVEGVEIPAKAAD